jgi:hypothetical protein
MFKGVKLDVRLKLAKQTIALHSVVKFQEITQHATLEISQTP